MSHATRTPIPVVDRLLNKPWLRARVGAGTPGSSPRARSTDLGITPRRLGQFRSHNARRVTGANPASPRPAATKTYRCFSATRTESRSRSTPLSARSASRSSARADRGKANGGSPSVRGFHRSPRRISRWPTTHERRAAGAKGPPLPWTVPRTSCTTDRFQA